MRIAFTELSARLLLLIGLISALLGDFEIAHILIGAAVCNAILSLKE